MALALRALPCVEGGAGAPMPVFEAAPSTPPPSPPLAPAPLEGASSPPLGAGTQEALDKLIGDLGIDVSAVAFDEGDYGGIDEHYVEPPAEDKVTARPVFITKDVFSLNKSGTKTLHVGICLERMESAVMLLGDPKKPALRLIPAELFLLQKETIMKRLLAGFDDPCARNPFNVGGIRCSWNEVEVGVFLRLARTIQGREIFLQYAKNTVETWQLLGDCIERTLEAQQRDVPHIVDLHEQVVCQTLAAMQQRDIGTKPLDVQHLALQNSHSELHYGQMWEGCGFSLEKARLEMLTVHFDRMYERIMSRRRSLVPIDVSYDTCGIWRTQE